MSTPYGKAKANTEVSIVRIVSKDSNTSLTASEYSILLQPEMETSYVNRILVTPQTVAVCTFESIHIFKRLNVQSGHSSESIFSPECEFFRVVKNIGGGAMASKLVPKGILCNDDILIFQIPAPRQEFNSKEPSSGGSIYFVNVRTNATILRVAGMLHYPISVGAWLAESPHASLKVSSSMKSIVSIGSSTLLSNIVLNSAEEGSRTEIDIFSETMTEEASDPAADFDVNAVIEPTSGMVAETTRKALQKAISSYSGKKGGRLAKLIEAIDAAPTHLRSEATTFALVAACVNEIPELVIQLLQQCDGTKLPQPIWMLRCEVGPMYMQKQALEEATVKTTSKAAQQALKAFLSTALGSLFVIRPEVALFLVSTYCVGSTRENSQTIKVLVVMLLGVIGYGYCVGGSFCCLNSPGLIKTSAPKEVVVSLLKKLLEAIGDDKMILLDPTTLNMLESRFSNLQSPELVSHIKSLLARQSIAMSSESNEETSAEIRAAERDWLGYMRIVERIDNWLSSLVGQNNKFDVPKAEAELKEIGEIFGNSSNPYLLNEFMLAVAVKSRAPIVGKSKQMVPESQLYTMIDQSIYRDFPTTILAAACREERVEREGDEGLEEYLTLRSKLLVLVLEAVGRNEVNRMSVSKLVHGATEPRLPIDLLCSPTLISVFLDTCERLEILIDYSRSQVLFQLVGFNSFFGCRLPKHGSQTDSYLPRYTLLSRVLRSSNFPLPVKESAIKIIRNFQADLAARNEHARFSNQSLNESSKLEAFTNFALKILNES